MANNIMTLFWTSIVMITIAFSIDLPTKVNSTTVNGTLESQEKILTNTDQDRPKVFTSFYPIYDFVNKIGKDMVDASTIVPAGV